MAAGLLMADADTTDTTDVAEDDVEDIIVEELEAEPDEVEIEIRELITMLRLEIGIQWMSVELRFQIEKVEELLDLRGTVPTVY